MAGYSQTPLIKKLDYQLGATVYVAGPEAFGRQLTTGGIETVTDLPADWGHFFFLNAAELAKFARTNLESFRKGFWVSWPKKASGVKTDLTEQSFRDALLPLGWVDTKVCAIDDTWSGLKFLRRRVK